VAVEDRYLTLLSSLPAHGPLFGARHTPLSWLRLEQRLKWLEDEDASDIERLSSLVSWHQQRFEVEDEELILAAERSVNELHNDFARDFAIWRLELRTLVAALRRRHAGGKPPTGRRWGFGRWVPLILRNWNDPHFRLERIHPWLPEARRMLDGGDPRGLERLLLATVWSHLERLDGEHSFDFEAVVIYVMRWQLIARLIREDSPAALDRFDALLDEACAGNGGLLDNAGQALASASASSARAA
jgi:hypothetical protein